MIFEVKHYNEIKEKIMPRLISIAGNEEMLADMPHRKIEDMAMIYSIVFETEPNLKTGFITYEVLEILEATEEQLYEDAMTAAPELLPATIRNINGLLFDLAEMSEMPELYDACIELPLARMYVVSNNIYTSGASAILYPKTLKQLSNEFGSFFVLPSSINEVIIMPESAGTPVDVLKEIVKEVNATEVAPEDKLTDSVYYYNAVTREFKKVNA